MIFRQEGKTYYAEDWCDLEEDEVAIAIITQSLEDLFYRAEIVYNRPLSCGHLKRLAKKVCELNKKNRNGDL